MPFDIQCYTSICEQFLNLDFCVGFQSLGAAGKRPTDWLLRVLPWFFRHSGRLTRQECPEPRTPGTDLLSSVLHFQVPVALLSPRYQRCLSVSCTKDVYQFVVLSMFINKICQKFSQPSLALKGRSLSKKIFYKF